MKFTKMHGIGNDYIYFNCFEEKIENPSELSVKLSERHTGVGGDGIVLIMPSDTADFRMRMFNADGSEGKMCGNATRCIGKYVYERGMTDKTDFTLETLGGIKTIHLDIENSRVKTITVNMGKAEFEADKIPVLSDSGEIINKECEIAGGREKITCVSMGNPHCVIFSNGVRGLELDKIGAKYENDPMSPRAGKYRICRADRRENIFYACLGARQRRNNGMRHRCLCGCFRGGKMRYCQFG